MKKLLFIFGISLAFMACNGNSTVTNETNLDTDTVVVDSMIDTISID